MNDRLSQTPNYPVIVVYLADQHGLTACSGNPMPDEVPSAYDNVPRYFCRACALYGKDTPNG